MTVNLYSIYDNVAEESGPIFQAKNDKVAYRQFCNLVTDPDKRSEYRLYALGQFFTESVEVKPHPEAVEIYKPEDK